MRIVDLVFGWLLVLGGLLHSLGSFEAYRHAPMSLLWALSGSLAILLLAAINLLRARRPVDKPLAWLCVAGCLAWLAFLVAFGAILGNFFDFRILIQGAITLGLLFFSLSAVIAKPLPEFRFQQTA